MIFSGTLSSSADILSERDEFFSFLTGTFLPRARVFDYKCQLTLRDLYTCVKSKKKKRTGRLFDARFTNRYYLSPPLRLLILTVPIIPPLGNLLPLFLSFGINWLLRVLNWLAYAHACVYVCVCFVYVCSVCVFFSLVAYMQCICIIYCYIYTHRALGEAR